jgi:hypothetical protein
MLRPERLPNVKGFAPYQQVERQVHLPSQERSKNRVGIWRDPPAIREAAAGIFVWSAWGLYDTIKGDMFKHNNFSHDNSPLLDSRTYFLFCQDEKTTFFELGEAPNGLRS